MVVEEIIAAVVPGLTARVVDSVEQLQQIEPADVDLVVSDLVLPNSKPAEVIDMVSQRFSSSLRIFLPLWAMRKLKGRWPIRVRCCSPKASITKN